ncbi:5705_t:CDS:2, partial [Acaulospora colombiana]
MAPAFELSKKYDNVNFAKVDTDKHEDLSREYDITPLPTFLICEKGRRLNDLDVIGADR